LSLENVFLEILRMPYSRLFGPKSCHLIREEKSIIHSFCYTMVGPPELNKHLVLPQASCCPINMPSWSFKEAFVQDSLTPNHAMLAGRSTSTLVPAVASCSGPQNFKLEQTPSFTPGELLSLEHVIL
jgi:hypothetical protein